MCVLCLGVWPNNSDADDSASFQINVSMLNYWNNSLIHSYSTELFYIDICKWFISNIYLIQTGMVPNTGAQDGNYGRRCDVYANIMEETSSGRVTVCPSDIRYRHVYTSISNTVKIQIVNTGDGGNEAIYFAIAFQGNSF